MVKKTLLTLFLIFLVLSLFHFYILTEKTTEYTADDFQTNLEEGVNEPKGYESENSTVILKQDTTTVQNHDFKDSLLQPVERDCTAVTIVYYTNFGNTEELISLAIPQNLYDDYHKRPHPQWIENLNPLAVAEYITVDDLILNEIVSTIKQQTRNQEELANALLSFVQDKGHILSLRCYPSNSLEFKYPIETLVEMGGDCDAHVFLYATLLKIAGFKTLLIRSEFVNSICHVAVGVHLDKPPENSVKTIEDYCLVHNEERFYYAETTKGDYRVGDLPTKMKGVSLSYLPLY